MTAICPGGGASQPKAGYALQISMGIPAIYALLNNIPTPWAIGLAAYIGLLEYDLSNFCTTDPPAVPTITAADVVSLIGVATPDHSVAVAKFGQLIGAYAWYQFCECTAAATPAPPAAPPAPVGMPAINPTIGDPTTTAGCFAGRYTGAPTQRPLPDTERFLIAALVPPGTTSTIVVGGITYHVTSLVAGAQTSLRMEMTQRFAASATKACGMNSFWFDSSNALLASDGFSFLPAAGLTQTGIKTISVPATATKVCVIVAENQQPAPSDVDYRATWFCSGAPAGTRTSPCPPDPATSAILQQILELVTLIQRQAVPFAYVESTVHAGLSGAGVLDIQGLLGVKVDVTTLPARAGLAGSSPTEVFDLGFITFGDADAYPHSVRVERESQLVLPARCSAYTQLAYDLTADVVVTVTELRREP